MSVQLFERLLGFALYEKSTSPWRSVQRENKPGKNLPSLHDRVCFGNPDSGKVTVSGWQMGKKTPPQWFPYRRIVRKLVLEEADSISMIMSDRLMIIDSRFSFNDFIENVLATSAIDFTQRVATQFSRMVSVIVHEIWGQWK